MLVFSPKQATCREKSHVTVNSQTCSILRRSSRASALARRVCLVTPNGGCADASTSVVGDSSTAGDSSTRDVGFRGRAAPGRAASAGVERPCRHRSSSSARRIRSPALYRFARPCPQRRWFDLSGPRRGGHVDAAHGGGEGRDVPARAGRRRRSRGFHPRRRARCHDRYPQHDGAAERGFSMRLARPPLTGPIAEGARTCDPRNVSSGRPFREILIWSITICRYLSTASNIRRCN